MIRLHHTTTPHECGLAFDMTLDWMRGLTLWVTVRFLFWYVDLRIGR